MTVWAIVSDVHGRGDRLARALADARGLGATRILALGDIGGTGALEMLRAADADCVFGNWEASGLRGLPAPYRGWVARWPAQIRLDSFWAAHASPVWPAGLGIADVINHLRAANLHWTGLFPSLQRSGDARWAAFAELDVAGIGLFLHGHTHIQEAWRWRPGSAPESAPVRIGGEQGSLLFEPGDLWLVGVGSVGDPHDGSGACYVLYDSDSHRLAWRRA
jgi:predicted phosphodiesterase